MFNSLRSWINVPCQYKPFIGRSGSGTKLFGEPVDTLCYPVIDNKLITNADGAEVVSNSHLYMFGDEPISLLDNVTFDDETRPILHIGKFYRDGKVDIKVVYL